MKAEPSYSELTARQQAVIDLLWDYLRRDPEHVDRVQTAYGSKTQLGLVRTIESILDTANEHKEQT